METWGNVLINHLLLVIPTVCHIHVIIQICVLVYHKNTHTPLWWWVFCFSSHRDTETPHQTSSPPPPSAIPPSSHQWSPPERAPHHRSRPSSPSETHTHTHSSDSVSLWRTWRVWDWSFTDQQHGITALIHRRKTRQDLQQHLRNKHTHTPSLWGTAQTSGSLLIMIIRGYFAKCVIVLVS